MPTSRLSHYTLLDPLGEGGMGAAYLDTSQRPLLERIGTPPELKRHFIFDGGHVPPRPQEVVGEMLDWFDRHLGPVDRVSAVGAPLRFPD